MNFAEMLQEQAQDMSEKKIILQEFDKAVEQVMDEMMNDEKITGMTKFLIPLTGVVFADHMKKILFGEEN